MLTVDVARCNNVTGGAVERVAQQCLYAHAERLAARFGVLPQRIFKLTFNFCLLYTSDAADDLTTV